MEYPELIKLYIKVVAKAKDSEANDIVEYFGMKGGFELISSINLGRSTELGWLRILRHFNFKTFEKAAISFLNQKKSGMYIVRLDDTYFHVRSEEGVSFGIFTEEYIKRDTDVDTHLHVTVKNEKGEDVSAVLFYAFTHADYLVQNN